MPSEAAKRARREELIGKKKVSFEDQDDTMEIDDDHHNHQHAKEGFEPLAQEYYKGQHIAAPVKEIKVILI